VAFLPIIFSQLPLLIIKSDYHVFIYGATSKKELVSL